MRVKQTARKSTGPRQDPVSRRMGHILETKRNRNSAGAAVIRSQDEDRRYSLPSTSGSGPTGFGNLGLGKGGKHITFRDRDQDVKIRPRLKAGQLALREIKNLQKGTDLLIPRGPFHRVVREITQDIEAGMGYDDDDGPKFRYQLAALLALQEAAEAYLTTLFEDAYLCTLHAKRVTLFTSDMQLCRRLRHD